MGSEQEISQDLSSYFLRPFRFFEDFADREKVPQGLGHLFLIDLHEAIVYPITSKLLSGSARGLCNFILVMREDQIHAPAMDIERLAQVAHRHSRTFDVPAWSTV